MKGLPTMKVEIPLMAGRNGKADPRALEPPALDIAKDIIFDEHGGIQTRYPFGSTMTDVFGGGTISNARRIVPCGDELLLFTDTALYSWNAQLSKWVSKGTHLAVKVDERTQFATTGDQFCCDRAELNGTIVFAWVDGANVRVAALDKTTLSVLMAPTAITEESRPRLVALSTKILLFCATGDPQLNVYVIDPASPATAIAGSPSTALANPDYGASYDAVKIPGADTAIFVSTRAVTTSYTIGTVTSGGVVSTSTKARVADAVVALSCPSAGTTVQVIRSNTTNIQGDYITIASFVDVTTGQAVGTIAAGSPNQIACAHRSVANSGAFRCYVFWSSAEDDGATDWTSKYNYVDTAGGIGTQANFIRQLGVGSRAFDHNGSVYVNMAFASGEVAGLFSQGAQLQNTYFLYRDDAFLVAKIAWDRAGGFSPVTGWLPGVALTSGTTGYSWCATERRIIPLSSEDQSGYGARAPRDVTFTFDSNEARRCARLGQTLYIAGGEVLQYDGMQLTECGYHIYPFALTLLQTGTGNLVDGEYTYKYTWRWDNARGEEDRSTTATAAQGDISGGPNGMTFVGIPLYVTHKTTNALSIEVWRTVVNPPSDSPFYIVTSRDPASTTNPNRYIANTPTAFPTPTLNDELVDADLIERESFTENGGVLESLAPPAASIIVASDTRLFLAGVAGDPTRVWYSKHREEGYVAAFHDALTVELPPVGGDITGLAFLFDTLVVFKEAGIYALRGDGFDNLGLGQNFTPQLISSDVGAVNHESIGLTPMGLLFKSSKGWYLLASNYQVQYVGKDVADYDSETPLSVHVVESKHQVIILTASRALVWFYDQNLWGEWTVSNGVHAALWQGTYTYLTSTGPKTQSTTYSGVNYGMDVETAWIKPAELQGQGRIRRILGLGEYRSAHSVRIRLARDYEYDGSGAPDYFDDVTYTPANAQRVVGSLEQFQIGPRLQRCQAIKVRLTVIEDATQATLVGDDLTGGVTGTLSTTAPSGTWAATMTAIPIGADGNSITFSVGITNSTDDTVEVRDHQSYNGSTETWSALLNNVGVAIRSNGSGVTVAMLEAAINGSELIRVSTPHASQSATISNTTAENFGNTFGFNTTGVNAVTSNPPTGEALKLTGLALLVGVEPGVFRRLTAGQKVGA